MKCRTDATIDELLEGLSEPQREAVVHADGPLLILAGPGSGKTRVVTRRAAYLAATVASTDQILAITFTNKAAREMQTRIAALGASDGMTVCTFHALCARLLRVYHERAGVPRNFTIFDRDDRRSVLKDAVASCGLSTDNLPPAAVEQVISNAKNRLQTADEFAALDLDWRYRTIARVYAAYEKLLEEMAGLDFDDLLMRMALLLRKDGELGERLEDRYRYVLVDEYQDTNIAQYVLARLLTRKRQNLCATGDPDQSIYGWRGANIENILTFEHDFPSAKVVRLEQNYRSTKRILSAADGLIAANVQRKLKGLWTKNDEGPLVRVFELDGGPEEAAMIAEDIAAQIQSGGDPSEMAVFYRVNSLSRVLEEALIRQGVAYQIARGVEFYGRKEIKDVLAYLRVLVNPADEVSLLRIINTPARGIGTTTIRRLVEHARATGRPVIELLTCGVDLSILGRSAGKVEQFAELLRELSPVVEQPAPKALEYVISHSGLRAMYRARTAVDHAPSANLDELISAASVFHGEMPESTLLDWLEHTALISDVDTVRDGAGPVTLMTLHAAKGLEFARVYIVGLEDGLLPFRRQGDEYIDEEEERRLLFVGMTRAKVHLTLSRARYRMVRGATGRTVRSPFLDEMPRDQLEWVEIDAASPGRRPNADRGKLPDDIALWSVDTLVEHPEHGLGQILSLRPGLKGTHVDVQFKDGPRKTWLLEFAPLKRVDFDDVG